MIKNIGTAARLDLEEFLERRVYLELFVRVEPGWREDRSVLATLDRLQLSDNTIVIFTSDNGGVVNPRNESAAAAMKQMSRSLNMTASLPGSQESGVRSRNATL